MLTPTGTMRAVRPEPTARIGVPQLTWQTGGAMRVLVVEDERDLADAIALSLIHI